MEFESLNFFLDYLASTGTCFSLEHRVALQASLVKLCNDNHFENVHLWGKILGTDNDYYIAYGIGKDYLKDRTYFYSLIYSYSRTKVLNDGLTLFLSGTSSTNHGLQWILLPPPTPLTMEMALASKGRFVGDPTADTETEIVPNDAEVIDEGEEWEYMKEEERLSATVSAITAEAALVPRGALMKGPTGLVYKNKTFEGLSKDDATQLVSYFHCRKPKTLWDRNIVTRPDYNLTQDFLESIANDIPLGCWTITLDKLESVASVRSLLWPGAHGVSLLKNDRRYHICGWTLYGWWYIGTGKKNWDLPFMITLPPSLFTAAVNQELGPEEGDGDTYEKMINPSLRQSSQAGNF